MSDQKPNAKQWMILRRLAEGPVAQSELCRITGRQPQAMAKSLGVLEGLGWVRPADERGRPGPKSPARLWMLTPAGEHLEATGPGARGDSPVSERTLQPHQGFVSASMSSREIPRLMEVLAKGQVAAEAATVARLDGDLHGYLFLFDPNLGAAPSEALSAALDGMNVSFTAGTVADVRTWEEFLSDARAARAARTPPDDGSPDDAVSATPRREFIVRGSRSGWEIVRSGDRRVRAVTRTREEAISRARELVREAGGGEILVSEPSAMSLGSKSTGSASPEPPQPGG